MRGSERMGARREARGERRQKENEAEVEEEEEGSDGELCGRTTAPHDLDTFESCQFYNISHRAEPAPTRALILAE
jgi:hypothetical protein